MTERRKRASRARTTTFSDCLDIRGGARSLAQFDFPGELLFSPEGPSSATKTGTGNGCNWTIAYSDGDKLEPALRSSPAQARPGGKRSILCVLKLGENMPKPYCGSRAANICWPATSRIELPLQLTDDFCWLVLQFKSCKPTFAPRAQFSATSRPLRSAPQTVRGVACQPIAPGCRENCAEGKSQGPAWIKMALRRFRTGTNLPQNDVFSVARDTCPGYRRRAGTYRLLRAAPNDPGTPSRAIAQGHRSLRAKI